MTTLECTSSRAGRCCRECSLQYESHHHHQDSCVSALEAILAGRANASNVQKKTSRLALEMIVLGRTRSLLLHDELKSHIKRKANQINSSLKKFQCWIICAQSRACFLEGELLPAQSVSRAKKNNPHQYPSASSASIQASILLTK